MFGPVAFDDLELLIDLEFLLSDVYDFFNFGLELVQLQPQDIIEAEGRSLMVEFSSSLILQLLPMAVLHVVSPQALDQVQHNSHVAHLLPEGLPSLDESHLLVDSLDLVGKALILLDQHISLNLTPELSLPVIVLQVHQRDQIPEGLQVLQIRKAFLQWLVVSSFQLEQIFQLCILSGLLFEFQKPNIVLIDFSVVGKDLGDGEVLIIGVRKIGFKVSLELVDLHSENIKFLLDLDGLVSNYIDDILFDLIDLLLGLIEACLRSFNSLEWLLLSFLSDLDAVLLQLEDHISHPLNDH